VDIELKQRLVGASVIIALAVIFIPMIFDDTESNANQSITIEIPDEPEGLTRKVIAIDSPVIDANSEVEKNKIDKIDQKDIPAIISKKETIIDLVDNSKPKKIEKKPESKTTKVTATTQKPSDKKATKKEASSKEVKTSNKKPISKKKKTTSDKKETLKSKPVKPNSKEAVEQVSSKTTAQKGYRLQYGVFSQQKNAQKLKAKIIHEGLLAVVEKDAEKNLYVVYSNPLLSMALAQYLSRRIIKLNLNIGTPKIEKLGEEKQQKVEMLLDTGWIIQIGSFSSKTNSIKLRDKIRKKGFVTFVDEILNPARQKRYRVRVGPYATRDEALQQKQNIKNKMKLEGIVKPHEKQKVISQ